MYASIDVASYKLWSRLLWSAISKWQFPFVWPLPLTFPTNLSLQRHIFYSQLWQIDHKGYPKMCIAVQDLYCIPHCNRLYKPLWSRHFHLIGTVGCSMLLFVFLLFAGHYKSLGIVRID